MCLSPGTFPQYSEPLITSTPIYSAFLKALFSLLHQAGYSGCHLNQILQDGKINEIPPQVLLMSTPTMSQLSTSLSTQDVSSQEWDFQLSRCDRVLLVNSVNPVIHTYLCFPRRTIWCWGCTAESLFATKQYIYTFFFFALSPSPNFGCFNSSCLSQVLWSSWGLIQAQEWPSGFAHLALLHGHDLIIKQLSFSLQ